MWSPKRLPVVQSGINDRNPRRKPCCLQSIDTPLAQNRRAGQCGASTAFLLASWLNRVRDEAKVLGRGAGAERLDSHLALPKLEP